MAPEAGELIQTAVLAIRNRMTVQAVSYTHLRAHETVLDLVCRLLLEKKKHYDGQRCYRRARQ